MLPYKKKNNMCLYPRLIKNPKYLPNRKNNYNPQEPTDMRTRYVPVGCGNCIECREQKSREWRIRLSNEIKDWEYKYFVTLTFSNESLESLMQEIGHNKLNAIAATAIRKFLERYRKKYKTSLRHWFITELGQENTERIHIHGIIFSHFEIDNNWLENLWKYGRADTGQYCNLRTINYVIKYVTKIDKLHKTYKPIILCSPGLGKNYVNPRTIHLYKYKPSASIEHIVLPNGTRVNLPIYYRNKFYTEDEREKLWIDRLNKNTIFVRGIECKNIDTYDGAKIYEQILHDQQIINKSLGYGDDSKEWQAEDYNVTLKMLNKRTNAPTA